MDELSQLEEDLRESLRHVRAPEGFADRVMARVEARPQRRLAVAAVRVPRAGWLAVAFLL